MACIPAPDGGQSLCSTGLTLNNTTRRAVLVWCLQEAEEALLNKLDQQLETISTGRRDELQTALQVLTYNMMMFHGRSLSTISTVAKDLDKMWPQVRDVLTCTTAHLFNGNF